MLEMGQAESAEIIALVDDYAGYETPYLAQHGISLLVIARSGELRRAILMDAGQSAQPVLHNMALLDIPPHSINAAFVSHCHYDHTDGLVGVLEQVGGTIPVIAHPALFRTSLELRPALRSIGIRPEYDAERIRQAGGQLILAHEPFQFAPGVLSTGEVPRTTGFETSSLEAYNVEGGRLVQDKMVDDLSLVVNVRDKGLVIVTGCAHAGIVNIIRHAIALTGVERIAGVVGGLHLISAGGQQIQETAKALASLKTGWVVAGHCTGFEASKRLSAALGDRFSLLHSGKRLYVGAGGS